MTTVSLYGIFCIRMEWSKHFPVKVYVMLLLLFMTMNPPHQ